MKSAKLFISFWDICLENLPEGTFVRRQITPAAAKRAITQARRYKSLLCVTKDDLLAPYCRRQRRRHAELCRVLAEKFGIKLALGDFCGNLKDDNGSLNIVNPLSFVQVRGRNRLIIVTCMFSMPKRKRRDWFAMDVSPSTVEFHLIEAIGKGLV
jgi:hypothetical protein